MVCMGTKVTSPIGFDNINKRFQDNAKHLQDNVVRVENKANATSNFKAIHDRLQAKLGKIAISSRYHRYPHKIEDDYIVLNKVLGSGSNGAIRLATSKSIDSSTQKFAVKACKFSTMQDKMEQLESEVEVFISMDHPHITRLYDIYESDKYLHFVMECMEGGELFDRLADLNRFPEHDAADAVWQMLLAVNYLHHHSIVHRDIKLENWLYDSKDSNHLKLIDFGYSKIWDPDTEMHVRCGTLSYVAPEVLGKNYTSQCDLWSLGVIVFSLLAGYMPFSGKEPQRTRNILAGRYTMEAQEWNTISKQAQHFTQSLLQVDPKKRLSAQAALEHSWIVNRNSSCKVQVNCNVVDALRLYGQATKLRKCCLSMMAWLLSNEERSQVWRYFISMDTTSRGSISLQELKNALGDKFQVLDEELKCIFTALDTNKDEAINYSEFLAAMVSTQIVFRDDLLHTTFRKFDSDCSGFITLGGLIKILGDSFEGEEVESLLAEVDTRKDGRISLPEFVAYLHKYSPSDHVDANTKAGCEFPHPIK